MGPPPVSLPKFVAKHDKPVSSRYTPKDNTVLHLKIVEAKDNLHDRQTEEAVVPTQTLEPLRAALSSQTDRQQRFLHTLQPDHLFLETLDLRHANEPRPFRKPAFCRPRGLSACLVSTVFGAATWEPFPREVDRATGTVCIYF